MEHYTGRINKFGIDIGFLRSGVIIWSEVAAGRQYDAGTDRPGRFIGVSAQVAAIRGVGANALIAGNKVSC